MKTRYSPKYSPKKKDKALATSSARAAIAGYAAKQAAEREVARQVDAIVNQVTKEVVSNHTLLWLYCLHEEMGFGHKRLERILGRVIEESDSIEKGYLDFDDINETLKSEVNMCR